MPNFWIHIPKPFTVLAPMDDVTDVVFREIVAEFAKPNVFFTEFINSDGLIFSPEIIERKIRMTPNQHPIVAQIWGTNPDTIKLSVQIIFDLGFDGVDINMGCPDKSIIKKGAGAGMIGNYSLASEIIEAAKGKLPVSVKTRLGPDEWIPFLLKQNLSALTIHGRKAKQMSTGIANWDEIAKAVKIRDEIAPKTIIIGNGDIKSFSQAQEMQDRYGVDGIMMGRGIFKYPLTNLTKDEKFALCKKHLEFFIKTWGQGKNIEIMKKFFKMYINDFDNAAQVREALMLSKTSNEMLDILSKNI